MTDTPEASDIPSENSLIALRREKLAALRDAGKAFPNDFRRDCLAKELIDGFDQFDKETLAETHGDKRVVVAGRMMAKRIMGKASFSHIQDMSGRIQIYVTKAAIGEDEYADFKTWDIGDIVGVEGTLFKTNKGELSIQVDKIRLLTKSLRPLPEKFHGLTDMEQRYRQRYVDLIMNEDARETFRKRAAIVDYIRRYFNDQGYMEVETPMMQVIPGGASARPFVTHHNALDMDLFLRIAPELYLKRLVVGGFEKVFEINRNFRNEGLSTRHNPEFTMLEFYQAYADYHDLMNMTEELLRGIAENVIGSTTINYGEDTYDFSKPFDRLTIEEAILKYNDGFEADKIRDIDYLRSWCEKIEVPTKPSYGEGKLQIEIFEKTAEHRFMQPTFCTAYPAEVSPLARRNDDDAFITDRFEFFVGGREIANGFSELNDAEDQAARFQDQVQAKDDGDDEAMFFDEDYITALEYGLPPTAGEGIGIDRLVMMFTDSPSIRDVLLFPHMRPQAKA